MADISYEPIKICWEIRIVPNHWHTLGTDGAKAYLKKYGHNIRSEKIVAIANYARNQGYSEFADGMIRNVYSTPSPLKEEPDIVSYKGRDVSIPIWVAYKGRDVSIPIWVAYKEGVSNGYSKSQLVETSMKILSSLNPIFIGWNRLASQNALREICGFSSSLSVRTFLGHKPGCAVDIVGIDISVKGEAEADAICVLSRFEKYHLKHYYVEPGWTYFSAEVN